MQQDPQKQPSRVVARHVDICKYHQHRQSCEALGINDIRNTNTHKQKNIEWSIMVGKIILRLESAIANNSPATDAFKSEWTLSKY